MRLGRSLIVAFGAVWLGSCSAGRAPIVDVLVPADTTDPSGPYEIVAVIRSNAPIVNARVRWFTAADAAARPITMTNEAGTDRWTAGIPGQPWGTTIRFTVEVEDDEGHVVISPETATYGFKIIDPTATTTDAGTDADAGIIDTDAGSIEADGGTIDADAGVIDADAGTPPLDAGTADGG